MYQLLVGLRTKLNKPQHKMYSKVLCLATLLAVAAAHYGHSSQYISRHDGPAHLVPIHGHHGHHDHDYYAYPKYEFEYKVDDPHTGDHKTQHEHRDGDVVKGFYSLHEPDGSIRHVHYHGDKHTGFHADVKHSTHHIVPHHHVFLTVITLAMAAARPQEGHHHGHGHAYSSQSIVLHKSHGHDHEHKHHDHAAPQQSGSEKKQEEHHHDYYAHPKYEFEYKVEDPHTGDKKSQHESRDGDVVKGYYSLHDADGTIRIVHYSADKHSGFNAEVKREGHAKHVIPTHHH
ncbi:histidine-rich glycoprotein-like [Cydia pomonella]|uniref:histidine-rich glycoprotein-like n=1 Tax=Cydia pomonella TaxID=82600 RepID=UPI002ADD9759|nr:histidine-rich glycoprotein-like [Cydia pomonella]